MPAPVEKPPKPSLAQGSDTSPHVVAKPAGWYRLERAALSEFNVYYAPLMPNRLCHPTTHRMPWHMPLACHWHAVGICHACQWHMPWHAIGMPLACHGMPFWLREVQGSSGKFREAFWHAIGMPLACHGICHGFCFGIPDFRIWVLGGCIVSETTALSNMYMYKYTYIYIYVYIYICIHIYIYTHLI